MLPSSGMIIAAGLDILRGEHRISIADDTNYRFGELILNRNGDYLLVSRKTDNPQDANDSHSPQTVYYSTPLKASEAIGWTHYTYHFVAEKFNKTLSAAGCKFTRLEMPEYYSRFDALPNYPEIKNQAARPAHIIFRSTEDVRLLKPGYNIACFFWEFEVLKDEMRPGEHPFYNQAHMLGLCDEVWVACKFTRDVLQKHAVANLHIVPTPIEIKEREFSSPRDALNLLGNLTVCPLFHNPVWTDEESLRANKDLARPLYEWWPSNVIDPEIYITVLNPEDHRKNMNAMFRGFYYYRQQNPNAILLVKLVTDLARYQLTYESLVHQLLVNKFPDPNFIKSSAILFIADYLSQAQLDALYQLADFYLCTSIAESQNLPILEAMAYGVIPVSPRHTAMLDYLDDNNSIPIATRSVENFLPHVAPARFGKRFNINYSDERDVLTALVACGGLRRADRERLSANALTTVTKLYSPDAVIEKACARLEQIRAGDNGTIK
jgi:glycosyltransferase involved in cell wall biosynthesis